MIIKETTIGSCRLILGDCLSVLPLIEPVEHVICDPPYEELMQSLHQSVKLRRNDAGSERKQLDFQSIKNIRKPFLDWCAKNNKGWLLAFCNIEGVWHWRKEIAKRKIKFKTTCIWYKPDATPKLNGQGPAIAYECFTTSWCGQGYSKWNAGGKRGVYTHLTNQQDRTGLHPTEKPVSLMMEIIKDFTNPGETICDPFAGSGTTGVACARMGRKFIGIEKDATYYDLMVKRITESQEQADMFIEPPKPKQEKLL